MKNSQDLAFIPNNQDTETTVVKAPTKRDVDEFSIIRVKNGSEEIGDIKINVFRRAMEINSVDNPKIKRIIQKRSISLKDLSVLSNEYAVPIPLLLLDNVKKLNDHYQDLNKKVGIDKLLKQSKSIGAREVDLSEEEKNIIKRIARELKIKQEYHSKTAKRNKSLKLRNNTETEEIAKEITDFYEISPKDIRKLKRMSAIRDYLIKKLEDKDVFVSLGSNSNGVMPVKTENKKIGAFWLKNTSNGTRPWIFIDTKDDTNKQMEPIGRQVYALILMLVFITYRYENLYFNENEDIDIRNEGLQKYHAIVSEILLPKREMLEIKEEYVNQEFVEKEYTTYGVSPTFLLKRLLDLKIIGRKKHNSLKEGIKLPEFFGRSKKGSNNWAKTQLRFTSKKFANDILESSIKDWRKRSRVIFGKQYPKEKYEKKIKDLKKASKELEEQVRKVTKL